MSTTESGESFDQTVQTLAAEHFDLQDETESSPTITTKVSRNFIPNVKNKTAYPKPVGQSSHVASSQVEIGDDVLSFEASPGGGSVDREQRRGYGYNDKKQRTRSLW